MAFTDYETEQLHKALLKETRRCAVTLGMKKTSVDQLTKAVGIAKGSFYKFHDDEAHIRQLLEKYDLVPSRGISLAAATVRGLILTVSHKEQIGELYPQVLETLVYGACRELFE